VIHWFQKDYSQIHPETEFLDVSPLILDGQINTVIMDNYEGCIAANQSSNQYET